MTYINKWILLCILGMVMSTANLSAQDHDEGKSILVISNVSSEFNDRVLAVLKKYKYFRVIDQNSINKIQLEKERQKGEQFINGYAVEQGKMIGADFILENSSIRTKDASDPFVLYESFVSKLISVKTGEIVAVESIDYRMTIGTELKTLFTFKDFRINMIDQCITALLINQFEALTVKIVRNEIVDGDAVKQVLLLGGKLKGVVKKQQYDLFVLKEETIEGLKRKQKVLFGKIVIEKVEDDNFSIGKVTDGGKILKKYADDKIKVYCELNLGN